MVDLCLSKACNGPTELPISSLQLSGHAALEAAKKKKLQSNPLLSLK
jgi:hypothetical protein